MSYFKATMIISQADDPRYQKVRGDPAFPPTSLERQEEYVRRMIEKDREAELRSKLPND